jgi:hypothetical protein
MNRIQIAALSLLAMASTATIADSGNGPRYRDLVRENRDARDAAQQQQQQQPERRAPDVAQRDDRGPRFGRDDGRRHDDKRHYDDKRYDDKRHGDRRYDDRRWRDDDRRRDGRYDDDRRWRDDGRRYDDRRRDERRWHGQRDYRDARGRAWHYDPGWYQSWRHRHYRHDGGRYYARERFHIGVYVVPRSYVQRVWRSGDWLPRSYWHDAARYELRGWWRYGLYDPPYWATWVRVRDDAVLIDRDNGEVIDVVYDLFW